MRSEFEFIRNIKKKHGLNRVGDDCAVLDKDPGTDLVVSADMLVEGVDFRLKWTTPELLGHKALAVSLSDIAAMGAAPKWALLSLAVPEKLWKGNFMDRFYDGWSKLAGEHGVELVGGDISRMDGKLTIDSVVAGECRKGKAILRSGARPGDSIFVTGSLGGAAGGLKLLDSGFDRSRARGPKKRLIVRQLAPTARTDAGKIISRRQIATAMIDISDGLAADLHHLCEASGVGAAIDASSLPIDPDLRSVFRDESFEFALGGGEDFELLFTSRRKKISAIDSLPVTRIGIITESSGRIDLMVNGVARKLPSLGYRHF